MVSTILSSPFFIELVLPFLLVFTLIFAILDKTKILGEGKRQINAIISFVIGLMLIAFPYPRDIIVNLMPLLAVIAVVLLFFLVLYTFATGSEFKGERWMKIVFGILVGLALAIALLYFSGYWDLVLETIIGGNSTVAANIFFVIIIIVAIVVVLVSGKKSNKSE